MEHPERGRYHQVQRFGVVGFLLILRFNARVILPADFLHHIFGCSIFNPFFILAHILIASVSWASYENRTYILVILLYFA